MTESSTFGQLLALLVHDLRNPAATLTANVDFLEESVRGDADAEEALMDLRTALRDLRSGLTRVGWIADGLIGRGGAQLRDGDAAGPIESRFENVTLEGSDFRARGGASIADIVEIFVENGMRHDRALPRILVREEGDGVRIVVDGAGEPMDASFRDQAFTIEGQDAIKGQRGGRYARFAGLVAARSYVEGLGGSLEASEHEGQARTIIHLPRP